MLFLENSSTSQSFLENLNIKLSEFFSPFNWEGIRSHVLTEVYNTTNTWFVRVLHEDGLVLNASFCFEFKNEYLQLTTGYSFTNKKGNMGMYLTENEQNLCKVMFPLLSTIKTKFVADINSELKDNQLPLVVVSWGGCFAIDEDLADDKLNNSSKKSLVYFNGNDFYKKRKKALQTIQNLITNKHGLLSNGFEYDKNYFVKYSGNNDNSGFVFENNELKF